MVRKAAPRCLCEQREIDQSSFIRPMRRHLNTLFITLEGAFLSKDGAAVDVRFENKSKLRVPLHNLDGIVTFGWDTCASAQLMAACAENKVSLSFHSPYGKFLAASQGFTSGNVLLRRAQYRKADDPKASANIARYAIAAKVANTRHVLLRALRDHGDSQDNDKTLALRKTTDYLAQRLKSLPRTTGLDELRGIEGDCAQAYFQTFPNLITSDDPTFVFKGRSRRPPLDAVNAVLSFLYSILTHDLRSACESCGLDPQVGFLHRDRPGRPSLALDLIEEFRPIMADRLTLSLINRRQLGKRDFDTADSGAVTLKDDSRKVVLQAYQERKQTEIHHSFLDERTTIGLLPHLQARLLARYLREDLDAYPAFLWK
jgi:CRISPR-associated protein Cas1